MLLELHVGDVSGFDLSALNTYWWHPSSERLDLSRLPYRLLSAPFAVHTLDLQARLEARQRQGQPKAAGISAGADQSSGSTGSAGEDTPAAKSGDWEFDDTLEVELTAGGRWNAIAFWFDLHSGAGGSGAVISSWRPPVSAHAPGGDSSEVGLAADETRPEWQQAAASWDPAVQYVDSQTVTRGGKVRVRVRQDKGQYVFTTHPPQCRPRHALGEPACRVGSDSEPFASLVFTVIVFACCSATLAL